MIAQAVITQSSEICNQANANVSKNTMNSTSYANPAITPVSIVQEGQCMNVSIATMLSLSETLTALILHASVLLDTQNPQLKLHNALNVTELASLAAV
jgi:hypothetical protein